VDLFWYLVAPIAIIIAAVTLVDIFRRHGGGWATAGWVLLVVILPFVGSLIYWVTRKASPQEVEAAYRSDRDLHRG
jgi:ABC-type phosphate transport system permease subunit